MYGLKAFHHADGAGMRALDKARRRVAALPPGACPAVTKRATQPVLPPGKRPEAG